MIVIRTPSGKEFGNRPGLSRKCTIGRKPGSDLRGFDPKLSSDHCMLMVDNADRVFIHDVGSTNGTFVDGQPVTSSEITLGSSVIEVGSGQLQFKLDGEVWVLKLVAPVCEPAPPPDPSPQEVWASLLKSLPAGARITIQITPDPGVEFPPEFQFPEGFEVVKIQPPTDEHENMAAPDPLAAKPAAPHERTLQAGQEDK